jgi:hypothetical protein
MDPQLHGAPLQPLSECYENGIRIRKEPGNSTNGNSNYGTSAPVSQAKVPVKLAREYVR